MQQGKAEFVAPCAFEKHVLPPIGLAAKTQLAEQRGGAKITRVHHRSNTVLRQRPEQQSDDGAQRLARQPLPLVAGREGHAQFSLAPLIEEMLLHAATRPDAWWHWAQQQGMALVGHPEQRFDHFYFSLQAAVAGLGIAMGPWLQVRDDLAAGLLSAPFGFMPDGSGYYLLSPQPIVPGSALARLAEWLRLTADA